MYINCKFVTKKMHLMILYYTTRWDNTVLANFVVTTKVPYMCTFAGTIAPRCIHQWERKFHGATKVPGCESFTPVTFAPGSEWSWERKVHNSCGSAWLTIRVRVSIVQKQLSVACFYRGVSEVFILF